MACACSRMGRRVERQLRPAILTRVRWCYTEVPLEELSIVLYKGCTAPAAVLIAVLVALRPAVHARGQSDSCTAIPSQPGDESLHRNKTTTYRSAEIRKTVETSMRTKLFTKIAIFVTVLCLQPNPVAAIRTNGELLMRLGIVQDSRAADGHSSRECLVVRSDRSYHLERRIQPKGQAGYNLEVYEGMVAPNKFDELETILGSTQIRALPDFRAPQFPISISTFEMLTLDYRVQNVRRRLGYFNARGDTPPDTSPGNTPENIKSEWGTSRAVLHPLVLWFSDFETSGLTRISDDSNLCTA
jgi:hypothetical protein